MSISDTETAKLYFQFLDENNPKSKYTWIFENRVSKKLNSFYHLAIWNNTNPFKFIHLFIYVSHIEWILQKESKIYIYIYIIILQALGYLNIYSSKCSNNLALGV